LIFKLSVGILVGVERGLSFRVRFSQNSRAEQHSAERRRKRAKSNHGSTLSKMQGAKRIKHNGVSTTAVTQCITPSNNTADSAMVAAKGLFSTIAPVVLISKSSSS
jgi:hypothetical protein